jgi:hypothetical protein
VLNNHSSQLSHTPHTHKKTTEMNGNERQLNHFKKTSISFPFDIYLTREAEAGGLTHDAGESMGCCGE